ncbi:HPr family phosphocarrier protein [Konateibacter massiliensis]|uniref:HPr family phosphocarrier protein n=1 Tax=Konateibacter massiliensis TaxID=2002841 RepID=UPI000C155516|nr:HPr family phosphocarrier protein [Konateibacter massiliensis]
MTKKPITIKIPSGLEARPVALLVQVASQYKSEIYVEFGEKKVNAKSIMGMMTLSLAAGESVVVSAEGADEKEAISDIERYLSASDEKK